MSFYNNYNNVPYEQRMRLFALRFQYYTRKSDVALSL